MDDELILERGESNSSGNIIKLDEDEQALLDEINIRQSPVKKKFINKPRITFQEDIDSFANPNKNVDDSRHQNIQDEMSVQDSEDNQEYDFQNMNEQEEQPSDGYTSIDEEKADLINKLNRLEKKGHVINKRITIYSGIDEIRTEYKRVTYGIEVERSIKFSRRMLVACVTGIEFLNKRYNPFDVELEGWSENVMENVDDYDDVFEELYVKYKSKMKVAPEIKLIMMLGGSAMMFHLTNSMFKTAMPNINEILKQNPGLSQNMMDAVKNTVNNQRSAPSSEESNGYQMKGPGTGGLDISSLMGNIMMPPPPPMNTTQEKAEESDGDDVSDIVSNDNDDQEVKNVDVPVNKKGRGRPKKKSVDINV